MPSLKASSQNIESSYEFSPGNLKDNLIMMFSLRFFSINSICLCGSHEITTKVSGRQWKAYTTYEK